MPKDPPADLYSDAAALWRALVEHAGLRVTTWDKTLVKELRRELSLGPGSVGRELERAGTSVERLVAAFLLAAEPFSTMLAETLALMEDQRARRSQQVLRIAFDFEDGRSLDVDLDHFRETSRRIHRVRSSLAGLVWDEKVLADLWRLSWELRDARGPDLGRWGAIYDDWTWPTIAPPEPPRSGEASLDETLATLRAIALAELELMASWAPDRRALRDLNPRRSDPATIRRIEMEGDGLIGSLVRTAHVAAARKRAGELDPEWEQQLRSIIDALELHSDPVEVAVDELLDILGLPTWKLRGELFAVWVLTRSVVALDEWAPKLNAPDGVLHMPFRPELMATAGPVQLWSEFNSPLEDAWGEKRSAHVQPDLVLAPGRADDEQPTPADVLLVLEAKQHWKAKQREWGYVLADYGRAFYHATVTVLSHARAQATTAFTAKGLSPAALQFLAGERPRLEVVSEVAPERPGADRLEALVQKAAARVAPRPTVKVQAPMAVRSFGILPQVDGAWLPGGVCEWTDDGSAVPEWAPWEGVAYGSSPAQHASHGQWWRVPAGPYELWVVGITVSGERRLTIVLEWDDGTQKSVVGPLLRQGQMWRVGTVSWSGAFAGDTAQTVARAAGIGRGR